MSDWDDLVPAVGMGFILGVYALGIWAIIQELLTGSLPL